VSPLPLTGRNVVISGYSEFWTVDQVHKPSDSEYKCQVLADEKLHDTGARVETESLNHLFQETGVSESSEKVNTIAEA
jgi:hypothetical protein